MEVSICSKCGTHLAISPEGLCNICDPNALSKRMKQEAHSKENDMAFLGQMKKVMRQERVERAQPWLENLKNNPKVISFEYLEDLGKYIINTDKFGIIDYFPKANKILIRKQNKWITKGLNWIINNI
jgi:hypothetical protein